MNGSWFLLILLSNAYLVSSQNDNVLITQTVYGFLDFTTTIGNTVMIFSPQSSPKFDLKVNSSEIHMNIIDTKPLVNSVDKSKSVIKPTKSSVSLQSLQLKSLKNTEYNIEKIKNTEELQENYDNLNKKTRNNLVKSSVNYPEYDLLSRQPEEFVEETYRLVNIRSKTNDDRHRSTFNRKDLHVSSQATNANKVSGSHVHNGSRTIQETSKHGPVVSSEKRHEHLKHRSSSTVRVLKTVAPLQNNKRLLETTSRRQNNSKHQRKNSLQPTETLSEPNIKKTSRHKGKRRNKNSKSISSTPSHLNIEPTVRRPYRTKLMSSSVEDEASLNQYTFMLNRRPGRWQYKSSPKPKVNIRKYSSNITTTNVQLESSKSFDKTQQNGIENTSQNIIETEKDLVALGSQNGASSNNDDNSIQRKFVQTLNVEISTPENFLDTYYEIATVKSPYIFQAGVVKKTGFITVTSTIEKIINDEPTETYSEADGPLTENILETTTKPSQLGLYGSITTLNPVYLTDLSETPHLETLTESHTLTQTKLKTQILPFVYDKQNETLLLTVIQTYDYTNLITVTRTVWPLGDNNFNPSKEFKDFEGNLDEAGSEVNLELEFGDEDNAEKLNDKISAKPQGDSILIVPNSISLLKQNEDSQRLGSSLITTRPVVRLETVWESYVVPLVKGTQTILRTLSKSLGVVEKTDFIVETSVVPVLPTPNPFSINPYFSPLLPIPQQQIITSSEVQQTTIVRTNSKVLKLTFGARTAYTTIFSTEVVPTKITMIITTALPAPQTAGYPNYFPPPYPPYAYVG